MDFYIIPKILNKKIKEKNNYIEFLTDKKINLLKNNFIFLCNNIKIKDYFYKITDSYKYYYQLFKLQTNTETINNIIICDLLILNKLFKHFISLPNKFINNIKIGLIYKNISITEKQDIQSIMTFPSISSSNIDIQIIDNINDIDKINHQYSIFIQQMTTSLFIELVQIILNIFKYQLDGGMSCIKVLYIIDNEFIKLLYILSICFEKTTIYKLETASIFYSEKYIICENFNMNDINLIHILEECIKKQETTINIFVPFYFTSKILEIDTIITKTQINNLLYIINLIKPNDIEKLLVNQEIKIKKWLNQLLII